MKKRFAINNDILKIVIVSIASCLCITSCLNKEIHTTQQKSSYTKIVAVREIPNAITVTKGDNKTAEEMEIKSMHLFIYGSDGNLLQCNGANFQSYQYIEHGSFLIDRTLFANQDLAENATICIVGNLPQDIFSSNNLPYGKAATLEALKNNIINTNFGTISIPSSGLPLFGEENGINLKFQGANNVATTEEINLKSLLSRVDLNITLSPEVGDENLPSFTLTSYSIYNIPTGVKLSSANMQETINQSGIDYINIENLNFSGSTTITSNETISTHFYIAEHKCLPSSNTPPDGYPNNIPEQEKQRYKPLIAKDKACYVVLNGIYTDIHGISKNVSYTLYLGANHTNDFNLLRNCQYKNQIKIFGLTNSNNPQSQGISIDHRVEVENSSFVISVERETMLDSHIEVRPIDLYLADPQGKIEVEIVDANGANNWFRLEHTHTKQEYFTYNLLTQTLANNTTATITDNINNRLWLYFDENTNVSTNGYREGILRVKYYEDKNNTTHNQEVNIKFRQKDLYPVSYNNANYAIEYYEEYLYNFDPKDNYGNTTDGFHWGLQGVQLSDSIQAITYNYGAIITFFMDLISGSIKPFYDYDNTQQGNSYNGKKFTQKIITESQTWGLKLTENPRHAAEYCYNKNKRNIDGSISDENLKWYLPAIDELNEIIVQGYTTFKVFQDKYYWSSQPSYENFYYTYNIVLHDEGPFRQDDKSRARATKVVYDNNLNRFTYEESGTIGYDKSLRIYGGIFSPKSEWVNVENAIVTRQPGNQNRSTINRIRCVRKL